MKSLCLLPILACACGARTTHAPAGTVGGGVDGGSPGENDGAISTPDPTPVGAWKIPLHEIEDTSCTKIYLATGEGGLAVLCQNAAVVDGPNTVSLRRFDSFGTPTWSTRLNVPGSPSWLAQGMVAAKGNALYIGMRAEHPRPPVDGPNPILSLTRIEQDETITWSKTYEAGDADIGGMVADGEDGVLITGRFGQTIDFGGHVLTSHAPETGDRWVPDIFVTRLDRSGNTVWAKQFGAYCRDTGEGIALTDSGDIGVVAIGLFESAPMCNAKRPWSTALLDKDGNLRWTRVFDTLPPSAALFSASRSTVAVVGNLPGEAINGESLTGEPIDDIWIKSFDADGRDLASKQFGGYYNDVISGFAVDHRGNFVLAGYTGTLGSPPLLDFGGGNVADKAGATAFVVKLDNLADHVWTRPMLYRDHTELPGPVAIAVNPIDEIYVAILAKDGPLSATSRLFWGKLTY